ncbi:MAG: vWA domain-containing protein [Kiritimatiellia bacterium]
MFRFATPLAFLLLVPWALAAWRLFRRGAPAAILFAPTHQLPERTAGWRVLLARAAPALFLAGTLLLIIAAARPQTHLSRTQQNTNAIAIEMVVDVSGSMQALDLSEQSALGLNYKSRLDVVKEAFAAFIQQRPDDLIGLVTFGGYAATRCPLTADHEALLHVLSGVEIPRDRMDDQGRPVDQEEMLTAIGDALATAVARLATAEPKTRIIVLLTDGDSNTGVITPEQALDAARKTGMLIFTIGVGSNGKAPFRMRDAFGRATIGYGMVSFNPELLQRMAAESGGKYFGVRDHDGMQKSMDSINTLVTTPISRNVYEQYNERYSWFLLAGALLTLIALTLQMQATRRLL